MLAIGGTFKIFDAIWAFKYDDEVSEPLQTILFERDLAAWGWVWLVVGFILLLRQRRRGHWVPVGALGRHDRRRLLGRRVHAVDLLPTAVDGAQRHADDPHDLRLGRLRRPSRSPDLSSVTTGRGGERRLAILLSMAMFVLVVDTSLMNVSISAVVDDLDTSVSGVQSAIALEALVSAAFILIGSKVADLVGRKRAYVLGLLSPTPSARSPMTLARDLIAIIVFWSVIGGLGASLLLPSMQALIHGNFEGAAQRRVYAMVGAAAAIAAAVGPLLGGFITQYLSWRVGFVAEAVVIGIVLSGIRLVRDVPYTGPRGIDIVGSALSALGMGGVVLGSSPGRRASGQSSPSWSRALRASPGSPGG